MKLLFIFNYLLPQKVGSMGTVTSSVKIYFECEEIIVVRNHLISHKSELFKTPFNAAVER